jgi:serine/threonine protein phosphatase PrpC
MFYYDSICDGSNMVNEDVANINKYGAWILDGATGLNGKNLIDKDSDAKWYVRQWDEYVNKNFHKTDINLKRIVKEGINVIKDKYYKKVKDKNIKALDLPSSSIVLTRWIEDYLEYFILGDCTLIIENNNKLNVIKDDSVTKLDNKVFEAMDNIMKKEDKTFLEARKEVNDLIIENRLLKNTNEGYWILGFDTEAADRALYGKIRLNKDMKVLIASDGFSAITDRYNYIDIENLIYETQNKGLDSICKKLREIEEEDSSGDKYPRFKKNDDASAIYVELINKVN